MLEPLPVSVQQRLMKLSLPSTPDQGIRGILGLDGLLQSLRSR